MLLFYWCFCNHSRVKVGVLCGGTQTCRGDGGGHLGGRWSRSGPDVPAQARPESRGLGSARGGSGL